MPEIMLAHEARESSFEAILKNNNFINIMNKIKSVAETGYYSLQIKLDNINIDIYSLKITLKKLGYDVCSSYDDSYIISWAI